MLGTSTGSVTALLLLSLNRKNHRLVDSPIRRLVKKSRKSEIFFIKPLVIQKNALPLQSQTKRLPHGVMVALQILVLPVEVRILVRQHIAEWSSGSSLGS